MKNQLFYTILRYKHGLVLGESLNAGILFFDPTSQQFFFERGDLKRIGGAYLDLKINFLKTHLGVLERNIKKNQPVYFKEWNGTTLEKFISKEILFSDASGLTFDAVEEIPLSEKSTFQSTKEYLKQLFLVGLGFEQSERKKRNEESILGEVYSILRNSDRDYESKIEKNKAVKTALIEFSFDFYWKSLNDHFAKAVSLDLEQPLLIQNKALQLYGALEQFKAQDLFSEKGPTIDLLVSKPQIPTNFKEFDRAIKIIDSATVPHAIHLEEDWRGYIAALVDTAKPLVQSEKFPG